MSGKTRGQRGGHFVRGNRGGRGGRGGGGGQRGGRLGTSDRLNNNNDPADRTSINRGYRPSGNLVCRATQRMPRMDLLSDDPNEPVAFDVEFQMHKIEGREKQLPRIGRISVVNTRGHLIYDTYAHYPREKGVEHAVAPLRMGFPVSQEDLWPSVGAQLISVVDEDLRAIFSGRPIIAFGMDNDKIAIGPEVLSVAARVIDVQLDYSIPGQRIALQDLIVQHLSNGTFNAHDPRDDAKATMLLYLRLHPYQDRNQF